MSKKEARYMMAGMIAIGIFIGVALAMLAMIYGPALAEESGERWVLCRPESLSGSNYVNIREKPSTGSAEAGRLFLGDRVETDGKKKNGFLHIINIGTETGDGWVSCRYLVEGELIVETVEAVIVGKGRVAVRAYPGGKRIGWIQPGETVTVYAWGDEWTVTSRGYIQTEFVEEQ